MKKRSIFLKILLLLGCVFLSIPLTALTQDSRNGYSLSPHGTIRVLLVFAEIEDVAPCQTLTSYCGACTRTTDYTGTPGWSQGQVPSTFGASSYGNKITQYYHDISLGDLNVIFDYYDFTVHVPCSLFQQYTPNDCRFHCGNNWCNSASCGLNGADAAIQTLSSMITTSTQTAAGNTLQDFDLWKDAGHGLDKTG